MKDEKLELQDMDITKLSSKGQIVIPKEIRKDLHTKEGDLFMIGVSDNLIVLKKLKNHIAKEDFETLKEIKEAWEEIEEGKFKRMKSDEFLKELQKW